MDSWEGKIAVVTGASCGIGAELAQRLVKEGMIVVGMARKVHLVEKMAVEWKEYPGKLYARKIDLSIEDEIKSAFEWTYKNIGPVSILVNNAALGEESFLIDGNTDIWKKTAFTNIIGTTHCTREAVRIMIDNNIDGHIVFIGDIGGNNFYLKNNCVNLYEPTKCAIRNLLECWRQELMEVGSKIKTSIITPGLVKSSVFDRHSPKFAELYSTSPSLVVSDIADTLIYIITRPPHCLVYQLIIKPFGEKEL